MILKPGTLHCFVLFFLKPQLFSYPPLIDCLLNPGVEFPWSFHSVEIQTLSLSLSPLCLKAVQESRKSLGSMPHNHTSAILQYLFRNRLSFPPLSFLYALLKLCLQVFFQWLPLLTYKVCMIFRN